MFGNPLAAAEAKRKSGTQNVKTCRLQGGDKLWIIYWIIIDFTFVN
jgi:hypothetical protein